MADVIEAVRAGLASYLASELGSSFPGLVVSQEWPAPGKALPPYALTVLCVGAPEVRGHAPVIRRTTPTTGAEGLVRYTWARLTVPLQLDAWAAYPARRDALAAAVRDAINRHPADTLGLAGLPRLGRRPGLVLPLSELLDMPCDYQLGATPTPQTAGDAAQAGEWRATWTGAAHAFAATEAEVALLQTLTTTLTTGGVTETRTV